MKPILLTATLIVLGFAPLVSRAALLVYEPFNYPVGPLAGQSGGLGFADSWEVSSGGPTAGVYDQNTTNVSTGSETGKLALTWDGKVNNLPSLPVVGARFAAAQTNNSNFEIHRTLATDAGTMAAANGGVLWLSAAYHWASRGSLGSGINIGLGNGWVVNRGMSFSPTTAAYIGANGNSGQGVNTWNYRLDLLATASGWTAGQYAYVTNPVVPPGGITNAPTGTVTNDLIVVLKYTLSATSNTVEGCLFSENDTLSEAAFYASTNHVSATLSSGIDPTTLNVLSVAQGRMANAIDEIRIGTSFTDVISLPPAGPVDANISTVTASPTNLFANGTSTTTINAILTDSLGVPVAGKSVTLASSPGYATTSPAGAQTTDTNGMVTFTATSTTAATEYFTATDTTDNLALSQTATVVFDPLGGDANASTVVASPTNIFADGIAMSTVTVTVKTAGGLPLAGKSVTLASSPVNATISPTNTLTTDVNGQAIFTVSSSTVGPEIFTATDATDSVVISQTASVEFSPTNADAVVSTVVASPIGVYADGTSTSTLTVTLKNSTGLPLVGKSVSVSGSPSNAAISPAGAQMTDTNGQVMFTVKSTTVGAVVFTATNSTDSMLVTQTATVNFVDANAPIAVNFNFYNAAGGAPIIPDPATLVGPNGGLGQVWNQTNSNSATNLFSSLGLVTSVGFTCNSDNRWPWGNPTLAMLQSGAAIFSMPGTTTITINGLKPGGYYNVWLASANCLSGQLSAGTWSTTNLTTSPASQAVSNVDALNGDTWEYGNNYVFFEDVQADGSGQIAFSGASTSTQRCPVNGFQLVETMPPLLTLAPNAGHPGNFDFSWNSKADKIYDLVSTNDLSAPVSTWPVWNDQTNLAATPPTNNLTNIAGGGSAQRYFAVVEKKSPVLLKADFEQNNGGFFPVGTPNDWAWGAPNSYNGSGLVITNGNGGSTKCWGTVLGDGSTPSGLITPGALSVLQSPQINFKTVTTASLSFAAAVDAASTDQIYVQILEAGTDAVLGTLNPIPTPLSAGWTTYGPLDLSAAVGKTAYLQFVFLGFDGTRLGLYIDDVVVTGQ